MTIDVDTELQRNTVDVIKFMEGKPHIKYVRYLLSKKIPLCPLRTELWRLGLSAPSLDHLKIYFLSVVWTLATDLGVSAYYKDYHDKLMSGDSRVNPILNFDITFEKDEVARLQFCKLVRSLEIEEMWSREITRFYGGIHNIPQDETGERAIKVYNTRNLEPILTCSKRYIIDKLLLEEVSIPRIVAYMKEKHNVTVEESSLYSYFKYFFNFQRHSLEKLLDQLNSEKTSIESESEIINNNDELSLGDKMSIQRQYDARVLFLVESIRELTARYSDLTYAQGVSESLDIKNMIEDMVSRGYRRFKQLDSQPDRDVVKPITEIGKMIFTAVEKLQSMDEIEHKRKSTTSDKSVTDIMVGQYVERYEESVAKNEIRATEGAGIDLNEIEGMDEV